MVSYSYQQKLAGSQNDGQWISNRFRLLGSILLTVYQEQNTIKETKAPES